MSRIPSGPDAIHLLIDLLEQRGIQEIELEEKDCRIRIVRASAAPPPARTPDAGRQAAPAARQSPSFLTPSDPAPEVPGAVRSEMVGTVYLTPEPDARPFVNVGDKVEAGQTLLLVEAMKTFSKIIAPAGGIVARILVDTGDVVDYGKVLLVIEPE